MELGSVIGVGGVAAVNRTRGDDPNRRLVGLHVANLHGRGVSPQEQRAALQVEAVHGIPRRVLRRDIESFEVMEIVFHLRAQRDLIADPRKDRFDIPQDQAERMQVAAPRQGGDEGDVHPLPLADGLEAGVGERACAGCQHRLDLVLHVVGPGSAGGPLIRGQRSKPAQGGGHDTLLSEQVDPKLFESCLVGRRGDLFPGGPHQLVQVGCSARLTALHHPSRRA